MGKGVGEGVCHPREGEWAGLVEGKKRKERKKRMDWEEK